MRLFLLFGLLVLCLSCPCDSYSASGTPQSVFGICIRPSTPVEPAAYSFCRGKAWFDALEKAETLLPVAVNRHLWEMDMSGPEVKAGAAALVFPLGAITPDISASREVRVFLENKTRKSISEIFANPEKLVLEILLQDEMRFILKEMADSWPDDLLADQSGEERLNRLAQNLNAVWILATGLGDEKSGCLFKSSLFTRAAALASEIAPLLLVKARKALYAKMPQKAQQLAASALERCEERLAKPEAHRQAWLYLSAWAMYFQGLAHWQLNQPALAKNDFDKALKIAGQYTGQLLTDLTLARANLSRSRGQGLEMCAELEKACALGSCSGLVEARRKGECGPGKQQ